MCTVRCSGRRWGGVLPRGRLPGGVSAQRGCLPGVCVQGVYTADPEAEPPPREQNNKQV